LRLQGHNLHKKRMGKSEQEPKEILLTGEPSAWPSYKRFSLKLIFFKQ